MGISGKVLPKSSGLMVRGVSVQTILMKLFIRIDVDIFVSVNTLFFLRTSTCRNALAANLTLVWFMVTQMPPAKLIQEKILEEKNMLSHSRLQFVIHQN